MAHTFLIEPGRWVLEGNWLERNDMPVSVKGRTIIAWNQDDWFTMVMKLEFPEQEREVITFQYRGHVDLGERQYTFVLQHSELGRVEGEGWITPESIFQRYWVLGDKQRRTGFETLHRLDNKTYYLASGIMAGHYLTSTMEATLARQ